MCSFTSRRSNGNDCGECDDYHRNNLRNHQRSCSRPTALLQDEVCFGSIEYSRHSRRPTMSALSVLCAHTCPTQDFRKMSSNYEKGVLWPKKSSLQPSKI